MNLAARLQPLRAHAGHVRTAGLPDAVIERFGATHPQLVAAIDAAVEAYEGVRAEFPELLDRDEAGQMAIAQGGFLNFYPDDAVNPYVALAARGPWVVTLKGCLLYTSDAADE